MEKKSVGRGTKSMITKGRKSYYYKYLVSFVVILIVPILTSMIVFLQASSIVKEQVVTTNRNILNQFFQRIDGTFEGTIDTSLNIGFSTSYKNISQQFISKPDKHAYYVWMLTQYLSDYKDDKYADILVYYPANNYVVSASRGSAKLEEYFKYYYETQGVSLDDFREVLQSPYKKPALYGMNGTDNESSQCVALRRGNSGKGGMEYVVVIVLSREYMNQILQSVVEIDEGAITLVLDSDQNVIFCTDDSAQVDEVKVYQDTESVYECVLGGNKYIMLSLPSKQLNAYYVYGIPYRYFWSELYDIYVAFLLGLLGSAVIGIVVAFREANRIYQPVGKTMLLLQETSTSQWDSRSSSEFDFIEKIWGDEKKEKHKLSDSIKQGKKVKRKEFIISMLCGEVLPESSADDIFKENGIILCSDYFRVLILQIEKAGELEKDILDFILSNVMEEVFSESGRAYVINMNAVEYCILVNLDGQHPVNEDIVSLIEKGLAFLEEKFDVKFTVGVSMVQQGVTGIEAAYKMAVSALRYRYLLGRGAIIEYSKVNNREFKYISSQTLPYIVTDFIAENSCDKKMALQKVEECLNACGIDRNASMDMVECFKFDTVNTFIRFSYQAGLGNTEWRKSILTLINSPTLDEFKEKYADLLVDVVTEWKKNESETDVCARARAYIEANYQDNQLSLSMISNMFGLTPSYFSKIFKEKYQFSIADYITLIRIDRAKELLCETRDSIQDIAVATGFLESNTFIRAFKKMMGITPGVFRSLSQEKPENPER